MTSLDAPAEGPPPGPIPAQPTPASPQPGRVESVDVLRGLTILLMVFVNDLGGAAPSWLHHVQPPDADAMTVADVVFPWFLFIVGVSIPLAFERAFARGATLQGQAAHILLRGASLLILGVIANNAGRDRTLGSPAWSLAAFVAILLAWSVPPERPGTKRNLSLGLKAVGAAVLVGLLLVYRRDPVDTSLAFYGKVEGWRWMRTGWWGILGLIGWAYLTVALLTLGLGRRREWLMGAMGVLVILHMAMKGGGLFGHAGSKAWLAPIRPFVDRLESAVDAIGSYIPLHDAITSLAAIVMAGCLLGSILRRGSDVATPRERASWAAVFALGLFLAGLATDTFEGINKIAATPTWCLWSAAMAVVLWIGLYLVVDVRGRRAWTIVVRPAGANPLIAYFLHPIVVEGLSAAGLYGAMQGYKDSASPAVVVAGSLGMAFFICALTGLLARIGLRVRL